LTEARQGRNPTAGTQEDGRPVLLRWTVYAGTGCCQQRRHCSVGSVRWNRSLPPKRECLSTQTAYHAKGEGAFLPRLKSGGFLRRVL